MSKNKNKNKKEKKGQARLRTCIQNSIPYARVYMDHNTNGGIIETKNGVFSKSYYIEDTNYSDSGEELQEDVLKIFEKLLNSFNHLHNYQFTINSRNVNSDDFHKSIMLEYQNDGLDTYRIEENTFLVEKMQEGNNNLQVEKYLTISIKATDIKNASDTFLMMERDIHSHIKKINGVGIEPISIEDRLEILHDIYNVWDEWSFHKVADVNGKEVKSFDLETICQQGLTTKDVVGPSYMNFKNKDYIEINDHFARVLYLKSIPAYLASDLMEDLSSISTNVLLSTHYKAVAQEKAVSFASGQVTNIGGDVIKAQKSLTKSGASPDLISTKLQTAQADAKRMLEDITDHNQKLFHISVVAVVFAKNKEDLDLYTEQIKTKAKGHICMLNPLISQQEQGFNTALPLAMNDICVHKVMTSYTASTLQPFAAKELLQKNGLYYGLNAISKNLIIYNRLLAHNQNGVILGEPGSGKSFAAKSEMVQVLLGSGKNQIFVIDPEKEYTVLAENFGGQVIKIAPGVQNHINPLDLNMTKDKEGDAIAEKVDYVISLCEHMLGGRVQISGHVRGIIDMTLQALYEPYIEVLQTRGIDFDPDLCPTLQDFYAALLARKEPEARNLASNISMYCVGSLNLFAYKTNIDTDAKFIVYDTSNIGSNLQELGMQICMNDIFTRMIENRKRNVRTWFYLDEFYLLLRMKSSAEYLQMVWKRARKWMGVPTGITQNVEDLLQSTEGITILNTSGFALMLNQAPFDRDSLSQIFSIPEDMKEYFSNAGEGEGLLYTGKTVVPFVNRYPKDTTLYKIMSTKPEDSESAKNSGKAF